ncbi:MAG TPA: hypothetical protein VML54_13330, partial [Candidatus Limnocylindrales bacterium]|nr:hypothetical protein [Candidatus Limnocylindrales bacterium]
MRMISLPTHWIWAGLGGLVTVTLLFLVGTAPDTDARSDMRAPDLPPIRGVEMAVLTDAPEVPPAIERDYATRVVVELETIEVTKELAPGV